MKQPALDIDKGCYSVILFQLKINPKPVLCRADASSSPVTKLNIFRFACISLPSPRRESRAALPSAAARFVRVYSSLIWPIIWFSITPKH